MKIQQLIDEVEIEYKIKKILLFNQPRSFWIEIKSKMKKKRNGKNQKDPWLDSQDAPHVTACWKSYWRNLCRKE